MANDKVYASPDNSSLRAEACALFSTLDWTPSNQALANFFTRYYAYAFPEEKVIAAVILMESYLDNDEARKSIKSAIRKAIRAKVLCRNKGKVEINFK